MPRCGTLWAGDSSFRDGRCSIAGFAAVADGEDDDAFAVEVIESDAGSVAEVDDLFAEFGEDLFGRAANLGMGGERLHSNGEWRRRRGGLRRGFWGPYRTAEQLAEKVLRGRKTVSQRLKPD